MRWRHPERGVLAPVEFLEVAEEAGLLVAVGRVVMQAATAQVAAWRAAGIDVGVCVNVTPPRAGRANLADALLGAVTAARIPRDRLQIEITEQAAVADLGTAVRALDRIRAEGMGVALDDFGTGHSSLAWLQRLPVDTLKLDRSFVVGLDAPDGSGPIVAAVMQLASALGLATVGEGVETVTQLRRLRELGCGAVQGFHVARPVPGDELAASPLPMRRAS